MFSDFVKSLNQEQRKAVEQPLQPVLVLAGPGTGKTRLLIARIMWLIEKHNLAADKILALTFTNKAAGELKNRLEIVYGKQGNDVYAGTIHSFALDVIRKYSEKLGLSKNLMVCDRQYQERLIRKISAPFIKEGLENRVKGILLSISNYQLKGIEIPAFTRERYDEYISHLSKIATCCKISKHY